jgi:hypothetical protein
VCRADNLTTFMCHLSRNSGSLNLLESSACPGVYRNCFALQKMYKVNMCKGRHTHAFGLKFVSETTEKVLFFGIGDLNQKSY